MARDGGRDGLRGGLGGEARVGPAAGLYQAKDEEMREEISDLRDTAVGGVIRLFRPPPPSNSPLTQLTHSHATPSPSLPLPRAIRYGPERGRGGGNAGLSIARLTVGWALTGGEGRSG